MIRAARAVMRWCHPALSTSLSFFKMPRTYSSHPSMSVGQDTLDAYDETLSASQASSSYSSVSVGVGGLRRAEEGHYRKTSRSDELVYYGNHLVVRFYDGIFA